MMRTPALMFTVIAVTVSALVAFSFTAQSRADVRLPAVLASHMVLQRELPVRIWGWADAGEQVTVSLAGHVVEAKADGAGNWSVELPAQQADGKSRTLTVAGKNRVVLDDILIGDVWIGSGQSNMEWQLKNTDGAPAAIAAAKRTQIRLLHVPKRQAESPANDVEATWKICTPETIPEFSAVLYYFGLKLNQEVDVPIGLINSSWGGSPIEPWIFQPDATGNTSKSGGMFHGMIAPLERLALRGVIWYQGETNVLQKNGLAYRDKMEALISGWRKFWGQDLPFYFVQIAPWSGRYEPGELPALWEAQVATLKIPHTGMVVTTDLVDDLSDIHPRNKVDVGNRLALWALADSYQQDELVYSGPLYQEVQAEGNALRLRFAHVADGLKTRDGKPPREFEIAGADGKFVAATAKIEGKTVVVVSEQVSQPAHVRFGWHKRANPNLVNSQGLPASPFQTDEWTGGTGRVRPLPTAADSEPPLPPTFANVSYGPHQVNVLDFWRAEGVGPRPLLVYIHGGGWLGGDKQRGQKYCQTYLDQGISYASINYRHTGEAPLPAPVHDAARAIQFIRSQAEAWNIDDSRIALTGSSAGACTSMWLLLHDDLADSASADLVLRESTRVCAAAVVGGQTSIDPKVIREWLGPNVLKHRMINMAVGEQTIEGAMENYDRHRPLYVEFSPYNHLDSSDPPLYMSYGNNMTLPSENAGHGIHHPVYGIKMKARATREGHECHLEIKGVSQSDQYGSAEQFLLGKLLAD